MFINVSEYFIFFKNLILKRLEFKNLIFHSNDIQLIHQNLNLEIIFNLKKILNFHFKQLYRSLVFKPVKAETVLQIDRQFVASKKE
jgi:hypothetical protein